MELDLRLFLIALGLAFMLEGLPYFLFAERLPKMLRQLSEQPPGFIRFLGLGGMLLGLVVISLTRVFLG
jgi:uncharacterized protein